MRISEAEISGLVTEVMKKLAQQRVSIVPSLNVSGPIFTSLDEAVDAAERAQQVFQEMGLEFRRKMISAMRKISLENAELLAALAREETGLGRAEHKTIKNRLVANKTPGVEDIQPVFAYTGDRGLTLVEYAPFGVVAAVTPSTNPTSTIINNAISILSAGNSVVFAPHPAAKRCCQETMKLLHEAILSAGGPGGLITTVDPPTQESTAALLKHPKVRMNMVTGGPAIVKVAMTAGMPRKTIAAGPGNPPVIVDETAIFPKAAEDIISGASFDNCVLCTGEKQVIVTEAAAEKLLAGFRRDKRAYELSREQMAALAKIVIVEGGVGCREPKLNRDFVGKDACIIAKAIGLNLPESVMLLWGDVENNNAWVWTEQLMPVLPVTRVKNIDAAIELAKATEWDNHHTASMYSLNVENLSKAARAMQCSIFVKNGPTYMGLGVGEGFATMSIGTPTGDGLTKTSHFVRPLHCSLVDYFRIA